MSAPLRNRVFLAKITRKEFLELTNKGHTQIKGIPLRCQTIRQFSSLNRLARLRHTVIRGERFKKLYTVSVVRHASSDSQNGIPQGYIPDVPDVPEIESWNKVPDLAELNALGEPTLQSIGLGSYWPPGLVQQALEGIHVGLDIPWWTTICICVVLVRTAMFPLIIKQRKTLVRYHNIMPQVTKIQSELADAQAAVDYMEAQKAADKMKKLMTDSKVNLRNIFLPMAGQVPVFMSVFFGLRKMAEYPVLSMQTGGCLWFENLTIADPTMMLSVITAATLWINLELGAESMKTNSQANQGVARFMMKAMPLFTLVITTQFPAAMCVYWAASNMFTLLQALFLRITAVRVFLGIPFELQHPDMPEPPRRTKIVKRVKDAYKTTSKLSEAQNRKTVEAMEFKNTSDGFLEEGWRDPVDQGDYVVKPAKTAAEAQKELLNQGVAKPTKTVAEAQKESLEEQIRDKERYI